MAIFEYYCTEHGDFEKILIKKVDVESQIDHSYCKICGKKSERKDSSFSTRESFLMNGTNRRLYKHSDPRKKGLSTS